MRQMRSVAVIRPCPRLRRDRRDGGEQVLCLAALDPIRGSTAAVPPMPGLRNRQIHSLASTSAHADIQRSDERGAAWGRHPGTWNAPSTPAWAAAQASAGGDVLASDACAPHYRSMMTSFTPSGSGPYESGAAWARYCPTSRARHWPASIAL